MLRRTPLLIHMLTLVRRWLLSPSVVLGAILVVALALRLLMLDRESLWFDESFSWAWSRLPWRMQWGDAARIETGPPLYYTLLKLWTCATGDSEAALRSLSVILGTLAVAIIHAIGRLTLDTRAALAGALFGALSATLVAYSQEARGYALLTVAALGAIWGLLRFLAAFTPAEWWSREADRTLADPAGRHLGLAAYALGTITALYTHNTAFTLPLLANVAVLTVVLTAGVRQRQRLLAEWCAVNIVVLLGYFWWLPTAYAQATGPAPGIDWMTQVGPGRALLLFFGLYGPDQLPGTRAWGALLLPLPLLAILVLRPSARPRLPVLLLLLFVLGQPLLLWVLGAAVKPMMLERTLVWPVGLGFLLIAAGPLSIGPKLLRNWLLTVLVVIQLADLTGYFSTPRKEAWRNAVRTVASQAKPQDLVAVYPGVTAFPVVHYGRATQLRKPFLALFDKRAPDDVFSVPNAAIDRLRVRVTTDELRAMANTAPRLWLILFRPLSAQETNIADRVAADFGRVVTDQRIDAKLRVIEIEPAR